MSHEAREQHPIWEGAVVGFLGSVELGLLPPEQVIQTASKVCRELLEARLLPDLGTLQQYLRERCAVVQLVAKPFDPAEMTDPRIQCVDFVTKEPRGHYMVICVGDEERSEVREQLAELSLSDELNEHTLRHDTGMLIA